MIRMWADERISIPREVFVCFTCNNCGGKAQGSVTGHGGDPTKVARKAGFVIDQDDQHWCPECAKERGPKVGQLELSL